MRWASIWSVSQDDNAGSSCAEAPTLLIAVTRTRPCSLTLTRLNTETDLTGSPLGDQGSICKREGSILHEGERRSNDLPPANATCSTTTRASSGHARNATALSPESL